MNYASINILNLFLSSFAAYLLAGKNAGLDKIKYTGKHSIKIINVRSLQKLVPGQLAFESIKQLENLKKQLFKGIAFKAAELPIPTHPTSALLN